MAWIEPDTTGKTGQSASWLEGYTRADLTAKERRVLDYLAAAGSAQPLREIGDACWPNQPKARRNSWARNSMRKLVRTRMVRRVEMGTYQITRAGKKEAQARS